ncbi:NAD(P)-dependent oxidoreductase [Streptomyces sp. 840.1]|uniref:NAD(P)-dependent oxidoreductase n=1 Tax=Streptomyces sp. 840.1 TaxID=2485152 RepID=UPI0011CDF23F|nr:NAD(P)-dependent oxidoreductase [Streptomyces sp. 840.1]
MTSAHIREVPTVKVVVIGGTGLIGSKPVAKLDEHGQVDTLRPGADARIAQIRFRDWLAQQQH